MASGNDAVRMRGAAEGSVLPSSTAAVRDSTVVTRTRLVAASSLTDARLRPLVGRQRLTDVRRGPAVARRGLTTGTVVIAALVPLALGCGQAVADPTVPPSGSIASGSSASPSVLTNGGFGSAAPASGSALGLGPAASALKLPQDWTPRIVLPIAPVVPAPHAITLNRAVPVDTGTTLGHMLGLQTGSVATACAGSAVAGSAGIALGLLTGSGLVGPGLVGGGSSGSSLGSVAVGSALTGSAVLTCLLLLPGIHPPAAELPLRLPPLAPPAPISPIPARAPAPPPVLQIPLAPARIIPQSEPIAEPEPPTPPVAWNVLELITVLVVSVIATFRTRSSGAGTRARP